VTALFLAVCGSGVSEITRVDARISEAPPRFSAAPKPVSQAISAKPLDNSTAVAAYSFRLLRTGYHGFAAQLRRESDNGLSDIGFTAAGDFDAASAVAFCATTRCHIERFYDQSGNTNTLEQTVNANQPVYVAAGSTTGRPVARWCATCGMHAADSATYKTAVVHGFMVVKIGLPEPVTTPLVMLVGYPHTATSDVGDLTWGLSNQGADILQFQVYGPGGYNNGSENPYGFGAVYRGQLYQYDFDTAGRNIKYNTTLFWAGTDASVVYANPVGLYVGMDAKGGSNMTHGDFAELILYGQTQAGGDGISTNQSAYWGISDPPSHVTTSDGYTWTPLYTGNFGASGGPLAGQYLHINGRSYFSEAAWDRYSIWQGQNPADGRDLMRFEVHRGDVDNINDSERSELDGAADPSWPPDTTVQISYAVLVEPGAVITDSSWLALGQFHYDNSGYPPGSFAFDLADDRWHLSIDSADNPVDVYTSTVITRNTWYDFFIEQKISSTGTADVLKVWINGQPVANLSGQLFPHGRQSAYWKYGIYRGYTVNEPLAVRYTNMEVGNKAVADLSGRIGAPLPHPVQSQPGKIHLYLPLVRR